VIPGLDGLSVEPCRKGGRIEALTTDAITRFDGFEDISRQITETKQRQLEAVHRIGWYDSAESSQGTVKRLVETGREMEALATDRESRLLVAEIRRQEKNLLMRAEKRYLQRLKDGCAALEASAQGDLRRLGKSYSTAFESIFDAVFSQVALNEKLKSLARTELRTQEQGMEEAMQAIKKRAQDQMRLYAADALSMKNTARNLIIGISLIVIVLTLAFGWFVSTGIARVLRRIIEGLESGSDQVAAASGQVSAASQSLAEGASEQASSIEETSSSLEELSSMTRQNAEHSGEANRLMEESQKVVREANESMTALTGSMEDISSSSRETSKIIKTIDEIAFQTNLLALNAAVEAARAGEAGSGFAVVADEVRNLAMRAAEAAKNTASLIEDTTHKVNEGADFVTRTNESFGKVTESAVSVAALIGEIAAASEEQAQGVNQINLAVGEMDKVVQQNAANAEESASASEEMNAQAEQMKTMIQELVSLVGQDRRQNHTYARNAAPSATSARVHYEGGRHGRPEDGKAQARLQQRTREIGPGQDLSDFEGENMTF